MSTTIYLIRHGQSKANEKHIFLGHHDMGLTDKGHQQAKATAAYLKSRATPDVIYSSDLSRAYQTAEATATLLGMPIVKEEQLREIYAGDWEELFFETIAETYPESFRTWLEDIGHARPNGGESVAELQERIAAIVNKLAEQHEGQVIFLFTHATSIRSFAAYVLGKTLDEVKDIPWAPNASVTKVVYEKGIFTLADYGRDDFMGSLGTKLPPNI